MYSLVFIARSVLPLRPDSTKGGYSTFPLAVPSSPVHACFQSDCLLFPLPFSVLSSLFTCILCQGREGTFVCLFFSELSY